MTYIYNDGGRMAAGFKGNAGDCVCRSICIATGLPYREVYDRLAEGNASQRITKRSVKASAGVRTARNGINTKRKWFKDYMISLGWRWHAVQKVGSRNTILPGQLPDGTYIAKQRRHYVAVIDGAVNDTFDTSARPIYGYWAKA